MSWRLGMALLAALAGSCGRSGTVELGRTLPRGARLEDACPEGALVGPKGCECSDAAALIEGACVPKSRASSFCGRGARIQEGGCAARDCGKDSLDLATGTCVPLRTLRDLLAARGLSLATDERPGCAEDEALVVDGERVACVQAAVSCGRGAHRTGNACVPNGACPAGSLADRGGCVRFLSREAGRLLVDVGTWTRLAIGPDGGVGSEDVCAALARRPWALGGEEGAGAGPVRIALEIGFEDNDVTRLRAKFTAFDGRTGRPLAPRSGSAVEAALRPLTDALHDVGGTADAASVSVAITCMIPQSREPVALPLTDGGPP